MAATSDGKTTAFLGIERHVKVLSQSRQGVDNQLFHVGGSTGNKHSVHWVYQAVKWLVTAHSASHHAKNVSRDGNRPRFRLIAAQFDSHRPVYLVDGLFVCCCFSTSRALLHTHNPQNAPPTPLQPHHVAQPLLAGGGRSNTAAPTTVLAVVLLLKHKARTHCHSVCTGRAPTYSRESVCFLPVTPVAFPPAHHCICISCKRGGWGGRGSGR